MSGNEEIIIQVEIHHQNTSSKLNLQPFPKCHDGIDFYTVTLHPDFINSELLVPFFMTVYSMHYQIRALKNKDSSGSIWFNMPWLREKYQTGFKPLDAVCKILFAANKASGGMGIDGVEILVENEPIDNFWNVLPLLPSSIRSIGIGPFKESIEEVPAHVWNSVPDVEDIRVTQRLTKKGQLEPEVKFLRPKAVHLRDEEPVEPSKRVCSEVVDFSESKAKAFVVLPDGDYDPLAETFSITIGPGEDDKFVFRAIPHEKIPKQGAHKLLGCNFERVRVSEEMRVFFKEYGYVDEEGKLKPDAKFNNDASAITLSTMSDPLFGRVVFVKK